MVNSIIHFDIEALHIKRDPKTGLFAIIAIYDLTRGPALGGCRCMPYAFLEEAINDSIRLSKAMNNKNTIYNLPYSGGKAVIIKPESIVNRQLFFHSFGNFINELQGKFITGCDIGVTKNDMRMVAEKCPYITAIDVDDSIDHLSYCTALGLLRACLAGVKFSMNKDSLQNIRIAIQGMGKIGYAFAELASQQGALLTICDFNQMLSEKYAKKLNATLVPPEDIYAVKCDIFSPCGVGKILNKKNIAKITASIICGGANDQLEKYDDGNAIFSKGILYIPDFIANGGGVIYAAGFYQKISFEEIKKTISEKVYNLSMLILEKSVTEKVPTHEVGYRIVQKINKDEE